MQKKKKKIGGGVRSGRGRGCSRVGVGRGRGGWLVAIFGVGGDVMYGGCEPRIEGIVQCTKGYCTILRKLKKIGGGGGRGGGQYLNPKHP